MNDLGPTIQPHIEGGATGQPTPPSPYQALGLLGTLTGLALAMIACVCGPLSLPLATNAQNAPDGPAIQQALALTVLGSGLGLVLAISGWKVWRGQPSRPFRPQRSWILWAVLLPLLAVGMVVSLLDLAPDYLLPPVNTLTMLILPALIVGAVGRALNGAGGTWRDVIGGVVSGASLGTALAMAVEAGLAVMAVAAAMMLGMLPGGMASLRSLQEQLSNPNLFYDVQALLELVTPVTVLALLTFVSVLTPLVEETTKTLGIGLAGAWLRPHPARAFLLGVASGAGFALAENMLNGALIGTLWGPAILSRLAATLMHCATSGLMGWGWGELWAGRRPWRSVLAFAGAVATHGVWNGLAIGVVIGGLWTAGAIDNPVQVQIAGLITLALACGLFLSGALTLAGLLGAARVLGQRARLSHPG